MLAGAWIGLAALLAIGAVAIGLTGLVRRGARRGDGGPILTHADDEDHVHHHGDWGGH